MEKTILLIDDNKEPKGVLDNIKSHLSHKESISLNANYIDPNDREYWNEERDPDLDKLIVGIKNKLKSMKPNLIIVDQYYSGNDKFGGIDVIRKLRDIPKFQKCSIFLYSGNRQKIVREIFEAEGIDGSTKIRSLAELISLRIDKFLDKNFRDEAIEVLKQTSLNDILPTKLRNYEGENAVINCFSPKYKALSFSELADKIDGDDPEARRILDEMFGLTLSHYAYINEKI
jgi:CheY-like chemotaxis protein